MLLLESALKKEKCFQGSFGFCLLLGFECRLHIHIFQINWTKGSLERALMESLCSAEVKLKLPSEDKQAQLSYSQVGFRFGHTVHTLGNHSPSAVCMIVAAPVVPFWIESVGY